MKAFLREQDNAVFFCFLSALTGLFLLAALARAGALTEKSGVVKSVEFGKQVSLFACGKTCFKAVVSLELNEELRNYGIDAGELKGKKISVKGLEKDGVLKVLEASDFEVFG